MVTRLLVKQDIINWWNAHLDEVLARYSMPRTTTATAADKLTLRDTALARGTTSENHYDAREIEIVEKVAGGPEIGESAVVDDAGFDDTDKVTLSPAFSDEVQSGTDYQIYGRGLTPEVLNQAINDVLRNTEGPHIWFPSMVDDADFGENELTNWAAIGTPLFRSLPATAAPGLLFGEYRLYILADAADEGATSNSFPVTERESLLVSVMVRTTALTCTVQLYNATASEVVKEVTGDEDAFTEVRFAETVPVGCENMSVRFLAPADTGEFFVSAPVLVQSRSGHAYPAPSWLSRQEQIMETLQLPQGFASEATDSYAALSRAAQPAETPSTLRADRGVNPLFVELTVGSNPVLLVVQRTFDELTSDSATTGCDREYVKWKVLGNILQARGDDQQAFGCYRRARSIASALSYGLHELRLVESEKVVL